MREFLIKLFHAGTISGVKVVGALVISKLLAIYAGPSGFAQFSQYQNLVQMGGGIAGGGIGQGLIRHLAENQDIESRRLFFSIGLSLSMAMTAMAIVIISLLSSFSGDLLFSSNPFEWGVLASVALLSNSMLNLAMQSLNGLGRSNWMAVGQLVGTAATILFAWWAMDPLGAMGAAVAMIVGGIMGGGCAFVGLRANGISVFDADLMAWRRHKPEAKSLMGYVMMSIGAATSLPVALVVVRSGLGQYISWEDAGQWSALWRISDAYLMLVTTAISVYYLPRLAAKKRGDDILKEIHSGLVRFLPLTLLLALVIWWNSPWIVPLILADNFSLVEKLIGIQIVGDVVKIAAWLHGNYMWAKGEFVRFIAVQYVFSLSFCILCLGGMFLMRSVEGVVWGYVINSVLHFFAVRALVLKRVRLLPEEA